MTETSKGAALSDADIELRNAEATLESWNRRALGDRSNDYSQLIEASERRVQKALAVLAAADRRLTAEQPESIETLRIGEKTYQVHADVVIAMEKLCAKVAALTAEHPEDTAEKFIQAAIDSAPEPLRRLGEYLARVLNEDQWATAERMLLGLTAEQGGADDRDSIMWTVCRLALMNSNSEAMRHQLSRLIAVSTGHAKQALQAMLIRAEQATQKPHVIAGPRAKLEWQGSPQPSDLLAKIAAWGNSTGGVSKGAAWDEIVAALTTQPQAEPADALENCRLFAARHRKQEWAATILRFCAEGGATGSPLRSVTQSNPSDGIELAARWVEKRLADYDSEHGSTDPSTGTREYPGRGAGDEYVGELIEIIEGIRALATPTAPTEPT